MRDFKGAREIEQQEWAQGRRPIRFIYLRRNTSGKHFFDVGSQAGRVVNATIHSQREPLYRLVFNWPGLADQDRATLHGATALGSLGAWCLVHAAWCKLRRWAHFGPGERSNWVATTRPSPRRAAKRKSPTAPGYGNACHCIKRSNEPL